MKKYDWNLFEDLTGDFDIPNLVNSIFDYGTSYINEMSKKNDFIRQIGNTFKCPDVQEKID